MTDPLHIGIAFGLDLLLGDPSWLPHPVRGIAALARAIEVPSRRLLPPRTAGIATAGLTIAAVGLCCAGLVEAAARLHPALRDIASIVLLYTAFAARDLASHSRRVREPLQRGDLEAARRQLGRMVGRDTDALDEQGIARATVESVAENTVDGVTAPLFFAAVGGPVAAWLYKAINTLDSTFGYKDAHNLRFGWASARIDDLANYLPARLTAPLIAAAAWLCGLRSAAAWRIWRRDGHRHPSPNAGQCEAAVAGALGVQLGGPARYGGVVSVKPLLGDPVDPPAHRHIAAAERLMLVTAALCALLAVALRSLIG